MAAAKARAEEIDLDLAWEFAPEGEFGFAELARDYFDAKAGPELQAAALIRLHEAPHYFRRAGKGQFKKAPEEIVKAALLAIERKKQQAAQIEAWAEELAAGQCPAPVREQLYKILFKPDKNAPEYKAVVDAAKRSQKAPLDLLTAAGAITSPYQFHWRRFLFETFPKGHGFPSLEAPAVRDELPLAAVRAFSIDDSQTTEIDDALSVQGLHRHGHPGHPHRRAGAGHRPRFVAGQARARAPVHRLHAGLQDHHAAGCGGAGLHAGRRP
jgi:exoribonuclease II